MPPEPAPWDRKESASRERKHERPPPDAGGGGQFSGARWRDTHRGTREFYSPSPRRLPPGHYKQVFADDTPSRSEDEGFRCYSGRYGSSSGRDGVGRGYLRRSPWNPADGPRPHHDSPTGCTVQRSVATDLPKTVVSPSATESSSPFVSLRDHHVRSGGDCVDDAPGTGRRQEREPDHSLGSIAWKPLKWPRSSSFPPPPMSSSAKAVSSEPDDRKSDAPPMSAAKASPVQLQADSLPAADDGNPRKKQRLGWGQGLAKYEKEKVEGPEVCSTPTGPPQDGSASRAFLSEPSSNLTAGDDAGLDSSASPLSGCPCSSPALEDKSQAAVEVNIPKKDASVSLVLIPENILPDVSVDIENLDVNSLSCVSSYVADLLSADDTSAGDLSSVRQLALDKLLLLKCEISKLVEKTEAVIDLCEIKLKNLNDQDDKTDKTTTLQQVDCVHTSKMDVSLASSASSPGAFQHGFSIENSDEIHSPSGRGIEKGFLHATDIQLITEVTSYTDARLLLGSTGYSIDKKAEDSLVRVLTPTVAQVVSGSCLEDLSLSTGIMESNRDSARKASEIFREFSPCTISPLDILENDKTSSLHIKEKLMVRKRALQFKERALTLKFKALHHLWREDLRLLDLLSAKKNASKLHKRCEVRSHLLQNGQPKPRSVSKSRFPGTASNKALLPTGEILDLTSHLITDSEIHIFRKNLKMPALVLDDSERKHSRFVTKNGFVEDPIMVEKEKSLINPWTEEEQEIFMEKLKMFGKDFRKIASFLDHKTIADCVEFYYKNHKLESFEAVRKSLGSRKQSQALSFSSYMVTSGKKWENEPNTASLDMLGSASAIVSHSLDATGARQKFTGKSLVRSSTVLKTSRGSCGRITVDSLAETTAADILAGIGGAMSSEGVSSCVTSSIDPSEKVESLPVDCLPFVEVNHAICEEDAYSDDARGELEFIDWSDDEKSVFIRAFRLYGKDFARIALRLGTRSREQCKAFFSKARRSLGLDTIYQGSSTNGETPLTLSDANGCRSDTDEACAAELDSTICSTQSFSKMDTDWSGFRIKSNSQEATPVGKCFSSVVPMKLDERFDAGDTKEGSETSGEKLYSVFTGKDSQFPKKSLNQLGSTSGDLAGANLNSPSEALVDRRASDDHMNARDTDFLSLTESGVLSEPVGVSNLNTKDAVETGSGRFHLDFSDSETVSQLANESFIRKEKKLLSESRTGANVIFDTVSDGGNTFHGKYGNYFLDTIFGHVPQLQQGTNLPPLPRKKSQVTSWKQKENSHSSSKPLVQGSSKSIIFGSHEQVASLPANFTLEGGKKRHPTQSKDHQPYMLGNQYLSGLDQPGHVLRGYPLHLLNTKDVEFDMLYQKPVSVGNISKKNGSTYSGQFFSTDFHADKSNKVSLSDPEPAYVRNNVESAEVLLRPCSQDTGVETEQQSTRTGDVKLFGKILSHPSPMPKPDSAEVTPPSNKEKRILNFRFPNGNADGTSDTSNAETSSHLGLAAEFDRGYDWLGGNKMQTLFSSPGTSALCLSKCPSVISGVAYHPKKVKPVNTGGILVHRGLFPADGKGQLVFPDLQNRVRIDGMAGFQQPTRFAVNMMGAMEALGCTVVSDPVSALRLHFAKQTAPRCSSEDSQRSDLGSG